jgi:hypothetical protein
MRLKFGVPMLNEGNNSPKCQRGFHTERERQKKTRGGKVGMKQRRFTNQSEKMGKLSGLKLIEVCLLNNRLLLFMGQQ